MIRPTTTSYSVCSAFKPFQSLLQQQPPMLQSSLQPQHYNNSHQSIFVVPHCVILLLTPTLSPTRNIHPQISCNPSDIQVLFVFHSFRITTWPYLIFVNILDIFHFVFFFFLKDTHSTLCLSACPPQHTIIKSVLVFLSQRRLRPGASCASPLLLLLLIAPF